MPRVEQTEQPRGTSTSSYSESPEQKRGWEKLADWVETELESGNLIQGDVIKVKGYVSEMNLDPSGKFFVKKIKDRQTGVEKDTTYTQCVAVIDDRRFTPEGVLLPLPPKQLGTSFFDGRMRDGSRGIARGAMYHLHLAVTFAEPPADLVNNRGGWDTDDYTGPSHPVLLLVDFAGWEQEGSQYYGSRSSLKVFLNRFERDPEARNMPLPPTATRGSGRSTGRGAGSTASAPSTPPERVPDPGLTGDDFDTDPTPTPPPTKGRSRAASAGAGAGGSATAASTATASGVDPRTTPATERQVKFVQALAREVGNPEPIVEGLTRFEASELIEILQRQRNAVA